MFGRVSILRRIWRKTTLSKTLTPPKLSGIFLNISVVNLNMTLLIFVSIGAYLAGSVNFAILLFKALGKDDPRAGFSGNPGATNVYRQAGYFWAVLVLTLDMSRALGVAFIALHLVPLVLVPWAGLGLILGNRFPCLHGLRGGKGVANYLGFTMIIAPVAAANVSLNRKSRLPGMKKLGTPACSSSCRRPVSISRGLRRNSASAISSKRRPSAMAPDETTMT